MAAAIRTRRPYMRFVAAFVFAVGTLLTLFEPLDELLYQAYGATPYLIVFETVQWLPALAAVMLLWTREPAGYYRQLASRTRQQTEHQRTDRMTRQRAQDRRKRARQASAKSRTQSRH